MSEPNEMTRRQLLAAASGVALTTGAAANATIPAMKRGRSMSVSPNEKITLGFVGVAGRGSHLLDWFSQHKDVQVGAICDVYPPHLERAIQFAKGRGSDPKGFADFRDLLKEKSIDAVVVAPPPHWHALVTSEALLADKDVYCEKPMCRVPEEGRVMTKLAKDRKRITQVGTQVHATENYRKCVDVVRSGYLGKITSISNFCTMNDNSEGLGTPPDSEPPTGLNWDMWLGPAPKVPFNVGRFRDGMHRYFKDYVDSWMHELGPHIVDLPFWAMNLGCPESVSGSGGRYATESIADVPDTMNVVWEWKDLTMTWTMMQSNAFNFGVEKPGPGRRLGIIFHGKNATLVANYGVCEVWDNNGKLVTGQTYPQVNPPSPGHEREFLNAIKSRQECSCSFEKHLPMHTALNLGHIAMNLGRTLHWDAEKWQVVGDKEANKLIKPQYRAPWKLPKA